MRLSQTQADVDDHRRRILGKNRLSGSEVGTAWMSRDLQPRAEKENVWSSAGNRSIPAYPHIGETYAERMARFEAQSPYAKATRRTYGSDLVAPARGRAFIPYGPDVVPTPTPELPAIPYTPPKKGDRNAVPQDLLYRRPAPKAPTQAALAPGQTHGGRSTLRKRRTGEAQSPAETQIIIKWDVRNDGDATANASLRLRQGATRIIATTQPVEVTPTAQKALYMLWNIPRNIALGGHNYSLDIMQTWNEDGRRFTKVAGTHAVTIDIVKGERFSQWDRLPEDVDLDIGI